MMTTAQVTSDFDYEALARLRKDLKEAAKLMTKDQARYAVDLYYTVQDSRIRMAGINRSSEGEEPNSFTAKMVEDFERLEGNTRLGLQAFANNHRIGVAMQRICGIGPVIAAGLIAHIDIEKAVTAGHIWRFAGLEPTVVWEPKTKRPWNADLKVLCFKIGESFVKQQSRESDYYGKLFVQRKALEWERNIEGANIAAAAEKAEKVGKTTDAWYWYSGQVSAEVAREYLSAEKAAGAIRGMMKASPDGERVPMLPPAHIHSRARRWVVKLFLSHLHEVWRTMEGLPIVAPYAMAHAGHAHKINPPPEWYAG